MAKPVGEVIAYCTKCSKAIGDQIPSAWCVECGEPLAPEIVAKIPLLVQREKEAEEKQRRAEPAATYNYQKIGAERLSTSITEEEDIVHTESLGYECDVCKADVSFDDNVCPNCGADISEVDDGVEPEPIVKPVEDEQTDQSRVENPILNRYRDLYRVAQVLVGIGDTVKVIGIVVGSIILLGGLVIAGSAGVAGLFWGAVIGAVYGGIIFLLGLLISAQGQMLLVQADSAVHSSPFMNKEEKAMVMSLSFPPAVDQIHG